MQHHRQFGYCVAAGVLAYATITAAQTIPNPRANPFIAPPFFPSGARQSRNLPADTKQDAALRSVRCDLIPRFTNAAQVRADLAYLMNPTNALPPSTRTATTEVLRARGMTVAEYVAAIRALTRVTTMAGRFPQLRTVAEGVGIPAWERCGRPSLAERGTQNCLLARGRAIADALPVPRQRTLEDAKETLLANPVDTVYWLGAAYCTWFTEAYQSDWASLPPPNPAITFLLENPELFCEAIGKLVQEGTCAFLTGGMPLAGASLQGARTACLTVTGPAFERGFRTGWQVGERIDRDLVDPTLNPGAQSGIATIGLAQFLGDVAFNGAAFTCGKLLKGACTWITEEPVRREIARCIADLRTLREDLSETHGSSRNESGGGGFRGTPDRQPRTIEHLEELLRIYGESLRDDGDDEP